jgi:hypothetical protein
VDEPRFIPLGELVRNASAVMTQGSAGHVQTGPDQEPVAAAAGAAVSGRPVAATSPFVRAADTSSERSESSSAGGTAGCDVMGPNPTAIVSARAEPAAAIREARLFRAALADAFDLLADSLAHRLAQEVLGRELQLAPVDLQEIAARVFDRAMGAEPLRLRVSAADAAVAVELPVVIDGALAAGDAILECRSGGIDARLTVRLAQVVAGTPW